MRASLLAGRMAQKNGARDFIPSAAFSYPLSYLPAYHPHSSSASNPAAVNCGAATGTSSIRGGGGS
jgi:hypothetical protein